MRQLSKCSQQLTKQANPEDYTNSLIGNIEELTGVSELAIQDIVEKTGNLE